MRLLASGCFALLIAACAPAPADLSADLSSDSIAAPTAEPAEEDHGDEDHGDEDHGDEDHHDDGDERRELDAHEHGAAELTVAIAGGDVAIDLQTPAFNVLGFEYAPTSEEEQALLAESVAALETGDLLQLDPDAGCTLVEAQIDSELLGGKPDGVGDNSRGPRHQD
jgi:hypothetical protein